jgi:bifunctional DNase/RNase
MVEMTVESVRINLATQQRVVILKAARQERYLFIWIAHAEAYAIAVELQGTTSPRPLTHDLLKNVISELGAKIVSIVISDLIEDIFYARVVLDVAGRHVEIDSRPSDAIALAVRAKTSIFVDESVLDRAGVALETNEEQSMSRAEQRKDKKDLDQDNLDAYRDFINSLDVLDEFGKD